MLVITSDDLVLLSPFGEANAEDVYPAVRESVADIGRWLPWCHRDYAIEESRSWIAECARNWQARSAYQLAIYSATSGMLLGAVGINHLVRANRLANLGYWLRSSHAGRGLTTRAVCLAARYAFEELDLTRLEIVAVPTNTASRRVAEKAGAHLECVARNRIVMHGQAYPAAVYSLIPADLAPLGA